MLQPPVPINYYWYFIKHFLMITYETMLNGIQMGCGNWSLEDTCPVRTESGQWQDKCPWSAESPWLQDNSQSTHFEGDIWAQQAPAQRHTSVPWLTMHCPDTDSTGTEKGGQPLFPFLLPSWCELGYPGLWDKVDADPQHWDWKMGPKPFRGQELQQAEWSDKMPIAVLT